MKEGGGVDKSEVLKKMSETLSPQKLAREKVEVFKKYCISILEDVIECFEDIDRDALSSITFSSPAGDAYGLDNDPINFGYEKPMDALEAMDTLVRLQKIADGDEDPSPYE